MLVRGLTKYQLAKRAQYFRVKETKQFVCTSNVLKCKSNESQTPEQRELEAKRAAKLREMQENAKHVVKILPLEEIIDIDLFLGYTPEKVEEIWKEYHKSKYCIAATVAKSTYQQIRALWELFPFFLLPVPRGDGVEFYVSSYSKDTIMFVTLSEYQQLGANATPALQIRHYTEFMETKSVVLMRGEVDPFKLDIQESQLLMNQIQLYYLDRDRLSIVRKFNMNPTQFDYNELLSFSPKQSEVKQPIDQSKSDV
eukprot:TRINITY_DN5734_c0_g1_i1.p1 TRINITY_DN5734_c0_g1~~TRINITY_DN5734_c0_g1_i1.p1  ORF type:complete len:254 (+),score=39.80 TRINITY_DN5734_c0_g1_i1:54-815(+)